ncbi:MAG: hypothetical protein HY898_26985 [Deltaproteobacteria bacterium]|nr:hypothetical protein [Deltaproteobacteria bacterium]
MVSRRKRRIVLFPYGQPATDRHRDRCAEIFLSLGGDIHRVIDGPFASLDRFVAYVRRIPVIHDGTECPIVMLTNTNPLALMVVNARRKLERSVPGLERATWVLCIDKEADPFFAHIAASVGTFEKNRAGEIVWHGPEGTAYLVVTVDGRPFESQPSESFRPGNPTPQSRRITSPGMPAVATLPPPETLPPRR